MHKDFVSYLVDPQTGEPLELRPEVTDGDKVISGTLSSSTNRYRIIRGIPRFVDKVSENYAKSFGYQWQKWRQVQFDSHNIGKPMQGHTTRMWEAVTHQAGMLERQVVVDIGCGPGRFIEVARRKGAKVIGIDLSEAVEAAGEVFFDDPDVCICQADALALPIASASVDGAFSIGVLHHTPAPNAGVLEGSRILKDGGWCAVAVYQRGHYYDFPNVQLWRQLFNFLWPLFRHYPPLAYAYVCSYLLRPLAKIPLIGRLIRLPFPFVNLPDAKWALLDTFDSVTPAYQSAHSTYEVYQWFENAGLSSIVPSKWSNTAFHGLMLRDSAVTSLKGHRG